MSEARNDRFDWKLVVAVTPFGLFFAALTITGSLGETATRWTALTLLVLAGVTVALHAKERPLTHGLATGFLAALVAVEAQGIFIGTYLRNNPQYAGLEMPVGLSPRAATMLLGPINAVIGALITGAAAWLAWKAARIVRSE